MTRKIIFIFGTRPEAIKIAPVVLKLMEYPEKFKIVLVATAQHRQMLDQVLKIFNIEAHYDLNIMRHNQSLSDVTVAVLKGIENIIEKEGADYVFVQGDTTTTFAGALAAFYQKIPVAHVEAGLRTYDKFQPFPEEINRALTSTITDFHFAPTEWAMKNLIKEGVSSDRIYVTGNTVIDALFMVLNKTQLSSNGTLSEIFKKENSKFILLTAHRRENHGKPLADICNAVLEIVNRFDAAQVIYPVHRNPNVREIVFRLLEQHERIHLIDPVDYEDFIHVMNKSCIILTDSGGIQEEAPSLGKPVLVLRNTTERPEGVAAGTVKLVGLDKDAIVDNVTKLLTDKEYYDSFARIANPYGDGKAADRIAKVFLQLT